MKLLAMTIPDDPLKLRPWLEAILVRGQVRELASELKAIHPPLERSAGAVPAAVLQKGLSALSDHDLRKLLTNPKMLIRLAEAIFVEGGPYWDRLMATETAGDDRVERGWAKLQLQLPATIPFAATAAPPKARRSVAPWLASLATAAAIFLAIYLVPGLQKSNDQAARWGWQKADELPKSGSPADYLDRIASLAGEWNKQDTSTPIALARKITEFREGCARLQLMEHPPLNAERRNELLVLCQKWAKKFDASLIVLETTGDAERVRAEMAETVEKLMKTLAEKAEEMRKSGRA